jgi:hypothetical protein
MTCGRSTSTEDHWHDDEVPLRGRLPDVTPLQQPVLWSHIARSSPSLLQLHGYPEKTRDGQHPEDPTELTQGTQDPTMLNLITTTTANAKGEKVAVPARTNQK